MFLRWFKKAGCIGLMIFGYLLNETVYELWSSVFIALGGIALYWLSSRGEHIVTQNISSDANTKKVTSSKETKTTFPSIRGYIGITLCISILIFIVTISDLHLLIDYRLPIGLIGLVIFLISIAMVYRDWLDYKRKQPRGIKDDWGNYR